MNSDVWINGTHLGNHPYGYTPFAYDLTPHLKEGTNVIAVRVNNTGKNSRWYSGSGTFRKVWLAINNNLRIPEYGISVTTPEVTKAAATVSVAIKVENSSAMEKRTIALIRLLDASGAVAESHSPLTVPANDRATATCELRVTNPHLRSPADRNQILGNQSSYQIASFWRLISRKRQLSQPGYSPARLLLTAHYFLFNKERIPTPVP